MVKGVVKRARNKAAIESAVDGGELFKYGVLLPAKTDSGFPEIAPEWQEYKRLGLNEILEMAKTRHAERLAKTTQK